MMIGEVNDGCMVVRESEHGVGNNCYSFKY